MTTYYQLLNKYNIAVPRYTSYPPVPFWKEKNIGQNWITKIFNNTQYCDGVDLYVHVPYCESLCFYCGCNRTITKDHSLEETYLFAVKKEWELYQKKTNSVVKVNSLHFGGGTPTFLSPKNLDNLITFLINSKADDFIGSIEIDPRTCRDDHLSVLKKHGFSRVSLGIQDFDPSVQSAINRHQTPDDIKTLVDKMRKLNFKSINFDLIYGLPKQTLQSINHTMNVVNSLKPELIAFYSYAHLPEKIKNQRLINNEDLPSAKLKHELFTLGSNILIKNGYHNIGMDHFGLQESYLYQAKIQKKLMRNFMGYTDKKSATMIGLGPTAISESVDGFAQNLKSVDQYLEKIKNNELPLDIGYLLTPEDRITKKVIQTIMCDYELNLAYLADFPFIHEIYSELEKMHVEGIIELKNNFFLITKSGEPFVRNVASLFDHHLRSSINNAQFSKSI